MRKDQLVESVRGMVLQAEPVADNTKVAHYKRIEAAISHAYAELMQALFDSDRDVIESNYVKHYRDQPVITSNGIDYVVLNAGFVSLPQGRGVWYVQPHGGTSNYVGSNRHLTSIMASLPTGKMMADTFYEVGNVDTTLSRVILLKHLNDSWRRGVKSVDYGLVRQFEDYDDTEEIHMPSEKYTFIIQSVLTWFGKRYNDKVNNGQ